MASDLLAPRHQAKLHRSRSPARATSFHIPSSKSSAFSSPRAGRPTVSAVARSLAMASGVSTARFEVDGQVGRPRPGVGQIHDVVEASGAAIRDLSDLTGGRRKRAHGGDDALLSFERLEPMTSLSPMPSSSEHMR